LFCADDNDAIERQRIWYGAAHGVLLDMRNVESRTALLPVDIVQLVGQYQLGRYCDTLSIFVQ
jgi:hypothetical protein